MERTKLHESQYASSLIEASLDPLIAFNTEGIITDMNQAKVNITGIEREKLIGTNFFDYFTEPHKALEVYQEVFAKGFVTDSPLTFRHKNGRLTDVLFNGSVYKDARGKVLGAVVVARDIAEQKWATELRAVNKELAFQNEEKEKREIANKELEKFSYSLKLASQYSLSLIEASLDPLITINPKGKITDMNDATVNITGITREKLTGTDFFDYFTNPQKAREVYQYVFANGSVADYPLTVRHNCL